MLKRRNITRSKEVKVTFALDRSDDRLPASVVGDFNGWDPTANPLRPRSNGTCSAVVTLGRGERFRFRYRSADGEWFNDDAADDFEPNRFLSTDCVIET